MLNSVYRLIAPRVFEPVQVECTPGNQQVVVRPTYLSICNADLRYYRGSRSAEVLEAKLPMALIHEGIGKVLSCSAGEFQPGQRVVMLPNAACEEDPNIAENYLRSSKFCGSGYDGFMQELMLLPANRLVGLPEEIENEVAAFTELVSVGVHAVGRFDAIAHAGRSAIGVWGDGNLGFIVSLVLKMRFPQSKVYVFGRNSRKLGDFTFADGTFLTYAAPEGLQLDHAFECCGGDGSASAVDQIISLVKPEATVALLGVSENPVSINTRMVLEKGLRLFGSSRSGRQDFLDTIALYKQHPQMPKYLESLVNEVFEVGSIANIAAAFEEDLRKKSGKTIMKWSM